MLSGGVWGETVSLDSPGWPGTMYIQQAGLKDVHNCTWSCILEREREGETERDFFFNLRFNCVLPSCMLCVCTTCVPGVCRV